MSSGVYVLQLKDNSKYYVGKSENIAKRINTHKEFSENCAKFVKINGGVNKVLAPLTPSDKNSSNWEKDETISRMIKHGYNNVRGWEFTSTNKLSKEELDVIKISIMGLGDRCRKCGNSGHFVSGCSSGKAKWLQKLEECYPCNTSCNVMNNLLDSCYEELSSDENSSDILNNLLENNSEKKSFNNDQNTNDNIITEIAKTSKAKCQKCKELIKKGEYRVWLESNFKGKLSKKWFHQKCYNLNNKAEVNDNKNLNKCDNEPKNKARKAKLCNRCGRKGHSSDDCYAETDIEGCYIEEFCDKCEVPIEFCDCDDDSEDENCCFRCGRPGHYANNCYAKKNIDGYYIRD